MITYAWCFSHGRLHCFHDTPWCTATWAPLTAHTEAEARTNKEERFGDAQFLDELPAERQLLLIHLADGRSDPE